MKEVREMVFDMVSDMAKAVAFSCGKPYGVSC